MQTTAEMKQAIASGHWDEAFALLYPNVQAAEARRRYTHSLTEFEARFGVREVMLISSPGRTEIGGNHTDHQRGMVLAAAVDLDCLCVIAPSDQPVMRIESEGHAPDTVSTQTLSPVAGEEGRASALIRGVADFLAQRGCRVGGLDAYTTSQVLPGSGLSSSAAFEVAVGQMLNHLYNEGRLDPVLLATAGQFAENQHFGKPAGLMDQMACSVGGFVRIDFKDREAPVITPVAYDFAASGHSLCIVDTKGSHADLTPDYAEIPQEMRAVAAELGAEVLSQVAESVFLEKLPALRERVSDRAVLRALHYYDDCRHAVEEAQALGRGDFDAFLTLLNASGHSSWEQLQNAYSIRHPNEQGVPLALSLSRRVLGKRGGCRVHGGGFAGTIQAFVPFDLLDAYRTQTEALFGDGTCHVLSIRPVGGIRVTPKV